MLPLINWSSCSGWPHFQKLLSRKNLSWCILFLFVWLFKPEKDRELSGKGRKVDLEHLVRVGRGRIWIKPISQNSHRTHTQTHTTLKHIHFVFDSKLERVLCVDAYDESSSGKGIMLLRGKQGENFNQAFFNQFYLFAVWFILQLYFKNKKV